MLLASMYFWKGLTNTFQLPCGMLMPTLFNMAAITGLSSSGDTFDPTLPTKTTFLFGHASLQNYIEDHHDKDSVEVFGEEHISFLTLWLLYYMLRPGSLQIAKSYISLAIQIHEGRRVSLGKFLLASLYHSLGLATLKLKYPHSTTKALNLSGPMWILQHWLNSTFKYQLGYPVLEHILRLNEDRPVEGARLALMTRKETLNKHLFMKYLNMFIDADKFSPGMAPFVDRRFGLKWFKDPFPGEFPQAAAQSNAVWRAFLTPALISFRIEAGSKGYDFMSYQPHLVARQFGLSQMLPKPLVSHSTDIICSG